MNMKCVKISAEVMGKSRETKLTKKMTYFDVIFGTLCIIYLFQSLVYWSLNNRKKMPDVHLLEKLFYRN